MLDFTNGDQAMNLDEAIHSLSNSITIPDPEKMRDALYLALNRIEQLENEIHFMKSQQTEMNRCIAELYTKARERKL